MVAEKDNRRDRNGAMRERERERERVRDGKGDIAVKRIIPFVLFRILSQ
jgi:hypothetical protein